VSGYALGHPDRQELENRIAAARTRLILDKPFLGALVLRLPVEQAEGQWCRTTATDARKFYYNAGYMDGLTLSQAQFVLAHEALHCALSHFARRQQRNKLRWDMACDYVVNPLLIQEGLVPPSGALVDERYIGMTAEEVYPCIEQEDERQNQDQHAWEPPDGRGAGASNDSDGHPPPLSAPERATLEVKWKQRLAGAAQQALQAGKLSGAMARMVDFLLQPQLPWRMLLARYMCTVARDDYNYTRPSSRRGDPAIFPSLRSTQTNLVVALDVSGSVSEKEMAAFLTEVDAIKGQLNAQITLLACDAAITGDSPWVIEPWEQLRLPQTFKGGGGTDFVPVFEWVGNNHKPDLLLYFTDARGAYPKLAPDYPVIWLVKGKASVPWGQRIQLN